MAEMGGGNPPKKASSRYLVKYDLSPPKFPIKSPPMSVL